MSGPRDIRLGAFRLLRPVGEGGMAVVWGGLHSSDVPVAVKILTKDSARDPLVRSLFRNEVRAVARLNHPNIISILDFGEVDAQAARDSDGRLSEGMPYLVMEYAGGGSLGKRKRSWSWKALQRMLTALLEGLSHAHSRGVVHRDIKPGNILLAGRDDLKGSIKLTDFGIAYVGGSSSAGIVGTVQYMAPEQHAGEQGAMGPWTDLYALGCLGWRVAAGHTPFAHAGKQVARAHMFERPPLFVPRFPVPDGFDRFLRVLLHKDPAARFRCCADALAALRSLPELDDDTQAEDLGAQEDEEAAISDGTSDADVAGALDTGKDARNEIAPVVSVVLPRDWRKGEGLRAPPKLRGAGLGLFALREIPLFGREKQRDLLWKGLRGVQEQGKPRAVLVRGTSGVGKTRLVEWLLTRAHEAVGAEALVIRGDRMAEGVAQALGVEDLRPDDRDDMIAERVKRAQDGEVLARLLQQGLGADAVLDAAAWRTAVRRLLEFKSADRPAILVVDDAHEADEALELAREVASPDEHRRAVLVVLVARDDEGLAQRPDQEDRIARVLSASKAKAVKLEPLPPTELQALLEYLGLSGSLGARVAARAAGNPQFAIQLVGDWISRDLLEARADGFVLKGGGEPPIPDDLHEVWSTRIVRVLQPLPAVARIHLERAAAMGSEIVEAEWGRACDDPTRGRVSEKGTLIRAELVERLLDARWIERTPDGFTFVHPMLRESLERVARKSDRWRGHHQAIATMLEATRSGGSARIGFHLLEAGRPAEAVDLLIKGHDELVATAGITRGSHVLLPLERAMTDAALPETDIRWSGLWRRQAAILRTRRLFDDALSHAEHARKHAEQLDDDLEWARCCQEMAHTIEAQGDLPTALLTLQKGVARLLRKGKKGKDLVFLLTRMAALGRLMNLVDDAERWAEQAIGVLERGKIEDPGLVGYLENELAIVAARRKEFGKAVQLFDSAQRKLGPGPNKRLAEVLNNRGDCLKNLGRWADAERAFREATEMTETLGIDSTVPRLNLIICLMHVGRYDAAREATVEIERSATGVFIQVAILARAVCQAALGNLPAVDRELGPAAERIRRAKYVEPDIVWLAEHGAEACRRRNASDQAVAFLYLAREQMAALGDEAGVARVSKVLDQRG